MNLLQLIWPDGAFLRGHVSIPDWLSWNQNSVFESQSEIDTWQGRNLQKLQVVEEQASWERSVSFGWRVGCFLAGRLFQKGGGIFFKRVFSIDEGEGAFGSSFFGEWYIERVGEPESLEEVGVFWLLFWGW